MQQLDPGLVEQLVDRYFAGDVTLLDDGGGGALPAPGRASDAPSLRRLRHLASSRPPAAM